MAYEPKRKKEPDYEWLEELARELIFFLLVVFVGLIVFVFYY